jgi:hypothetical protein
VPIATSFFAVLRQPLESTMKLDINFRRTLMVSVFSAVGLACAAGQPAFATVTNTSSSAYDISGTISLNGIFPVSLVLNSGASVTGSGVAAYSSGGVAAAGLNQSLSFLGKTYATLTSNPNAATASFNPAGPQVTATATGNNVSLNVNGASGSAVLSATLPSFNSQAKVSGDYGALTSVGSTTFTGVPTLSAFGTSIALSPNPTVNQQISSPVAGLTIIENGQTMTGNGTTSQGITVNALEFKLSNVAIAGVGTVSGDVIFGQSVANMLATAASGGSTGGGGTGGGTTSGGGGSTAGGGSTPIGSSYSAAATPGTLKNPQFVTGTGPYTSITGSIGGAVSKEVFGLSLGAGSLTLGQTTTDGSALYLSVFDSSLNLLAPSGGSYMIGAGDYYIAVATDPNHPDPGFTLTSSLPFGAFVPAVSEGGNTAVPEPASFILLGAGLLGLASLRRQRSK